MRLHGVRDARRRRGRAPRSPSLALVIADEAETLAMYTLILRLEGFAVQQASRGADAVRRARALRPAIIVTDLAMPMTDDWQTVRRLLGHVQTRHIPLIVCSGLDGVHGLEWPGAAELPLKPCPLDRLMVEVRRRLSGSG